MMAKGMDSSLTTPSEQDFEEPLSIADLFLQANRELAKSDARIYRAVDRHLIATRELLRKEELGQNDTPVFDKPYLDFTLACGYEKQTRRSLENLCREHCIRGFSRMSKEQMIENLQAKGISAPPIPLDAYTKKELIEFLRDALEGRSHDG
jgi:hypothetical protein